MLGFRFFVCCGAITAVSSDTIRRHTIHNVSPRPVFHKYFVPCVIFSIFFYVWGRNSVFGLMTSIWAGLRQDSWLDYR